MHSRTTGGTFVPRAMHNVAKSTAKTRFTYLQSVLWAFPSVHSLVLEMRLTIVARFLATLLMCRIAAVFTFDALTHETPEEVAAQVAEGSVECARPVERNYKCEVIIVATHLNLCAF